MSTNTTNPDEKPVDKTVDKHTLPPLTDQGATQHTEERKPSPPPKPDAAPAELDKTDKVDLRQRPRVPGPSWSHEDREANVAKGLATKEYIAHAGDAAHDAERNVDERPMVLINPFGKDSYIDQLDKHSARSAYLATKSVCQSLAFAVINAYRREVRNANQPETPAPEIDIFANEQEEIAARSAHLDEIGFSTLPPFDARNYAGVYKRLLMELRATYQFHAQYPVDLPHETLHKMQEGRVNPQLETAYAEIERQIIGTDNPALADIMAGSRRIKAQRAEMNKQETANEHRYVLQALQDTKAVPFDDDLWYEMPLYLQYRFSTMIYHQIVMAAVIEKEQREPDLDKLRELAAMAGQLNKELTTAAQHSEIKLAFDQGKLDERHDVTPRRTSPAKPQQAAPKMQRAPRPDDEPDRT